MVSTEREQIQSRCEKEILDDEGDEILEQVSENLSMSNP